MASGNNFARLKENSQDLVMTLEEQCESCKKTLDKAKLLKHIGNSKNCKSYYGSRFNFLKHNQELERKSKYREIKREEINENQRKRREQEKDKKMYFCLQRDCIVMGRRKNLRIMKQSENKKK